MASNRNYNVRRAGGKAYCVNFDGSASYITCGSGATLDNLGTGGAIFQAEAWVRPTNTSNNIVTKGISGATSGWIAWVYTNRLYFSVTTAGGEIVAYSITGFVITDGAWHHTLVSYNDTTKVARCAADGIWGTASSSGSGDYVSDAAQNLRIGGSSDSTPTYLYQGNIGWVRLHNHAHYTVGTTFSPPPRFSLPEIDINTVELWGLNEGGGTTTLAHVTIANNGTITSGRWGRI